MGLVAPYMSVLLMLSSLDAELAWIAPDQARDPELLGQAQRLRQLPGIAITAGVLSTATPRSNRFG
jgi:hypothetical protein